MNNPDKNGKGTPVPKHKANLAVIGTVVGVAAVGAGVGGYFIWRAVAAGDAPSPPSGPPPPAPPPPTVSIKGHWLTNFGSYVTITDTNWYDVSSYGKSYYTIDNIKDNYAIMQNSPTASYNPSKWSKVHFHETADANAFGYCQITYDADTAAAAEASDVAATYNNSDANAGCNGFGHTLVTPYTSPLKGNWLSNYNEYVTVTDSMWYQSSPYGTSTYTIEAVASTLTVMQNSETSYNPNKWSKVEFFPSGSSGDMAHCMSKYDADSAPLALVHDTSTVYNTSDANKGCNGFGFTILSRYTFPLIGSWTDNSGETLEITATTWDNKHVEAFGSTWLIFQYPADDENNPSKFAKVEFHAEGAGYAYCTGINDADTAKVALTTDTSALYNSSDATTGCNGSPFTVITAVTG